MSVCGAGGTRSSTVVWKQEATEGEIHQGKGSAKEEGTYQGVRRLGRSARRPEGRGGERASAKRSLDGGPKLGGGVGPAAAGLLVRGGVVARRRHAHRCQVVRQLARVEVVVLLPAGLVKEDRGELARDALPQLVALLAPDAGLA